MKIPIVKYNDKFLDRLSILMKIGGITLFPFIVLREKYRDVHYYKYKKAPKLINHESIHIEQQKELLVLPFYVLYTVEWLIKSILCLSSSAGYRRISFEREAKLNEKKEDYLETRKRYAWIKHIF